MVKSAALALVMAGAAASASAVPPPLTFTFDTTALKVWFNHTDSCGDSDAPDQSLAAFRRADGLVMGYSGDNSPGGFFASYGASLFGLKRNCTLPVITGSTCHACNLDPAVFPHDVWLMATWSADGGGCGSCVGARRISRQHHRQRHLPVRQPHRLLVHHYTSSNIYRWRAYVRVCPDTIKSTCNCTLRAYRLQACQSRLPEREVCFCQVFWLRVFWHVSLASCALAGVLAGVLVMFWLCSGCVLASRVLAGIPHICLV